MASRVDAAGIRRYFERVFSDRGRRVFGRLMSRCASGRNRIGRICSEMVFCRFAWPFINSSCFNPPTLRSVTKEQQPWTPRQVVRAVTDIAGALLSWAVAFRGRTKELARNHRFCIRWFVEGHHEAEDN